MTNQNILMTVQIKAQNYKVFDKVIVAQNGIGVTRYLATDEKDNVLLIDPLSIEIINP